MTEIISRKEARERGLRHYFTGKPCKRGHISKRDVKNKHCFGCKKVWNKESYDRHAESRKDRQREYTRNNKDKVRESSRKYNLKNKKFVKEYRGRYYQENREYLVQYQREWRKNDDNKKKANKRKKEYLRSKYRTDEDYKAVVVCRGMLQRTLKAAGKHKKNSTFLLLGYDNKDLKENVESKFLYGMSWENYGDWHIDHIYPVSRYVADGVNDPSVINNLDNLIPMWEEHNLQKSNRTLEEYLEEFPNVSYLYGHFINFYKA